MLGDPHRLRRGEAGHREVAGAAQEIGNAPFELRAFGEGAAVVPQDRRPQRLVRRVEKGRAVHLAGQADAGESRERVRRVAAHGLDGGLDAFDPVVGILLAPQRFRTRHVERGGRLGDGSLLGVDQQRLDRRRADVEPEERFPTHVTLLSLAPRILRERARLGLLSTAERPSRPLCLLRVLGGERVHHQDTKEAQRTLIRATDSKFMRQCEEALQAVSEQKGEGGEEPGQRGFHRRLEVL